MKTLTIILTDGPYISEYAEIAWKLAENALKHYHVNIFLYLDAVHIPKKGQNPSFFANAGGVILRTCGERSVNQSLCKMCCCKRLRSRRRDYRRN